MEGEVLLTDWNLLFQGVLIGASVLPGLRGCKKILFYTYSTFSSSDMNPFYRQTFTERRIQPIERPPPE
jgi:hypothetical protein